VSRHADIVAVSRDWQTFTSSRGVALEELDDEQLTHRTSLIDTDPPRQTQLRKVVASSFTPRVVNSFETFLRGVVGRALDAALPRGTFEFVQHVSSQVPVRVLCRLLAWTTRTTRGSRPGATGWSGTPTPSSPTSCCTARRATGTGCCRSAPPRRSRSSSTAGTSPPSDALSPGTT
jgi:cytochrome P450